MRSDMARMDWKEPGLLARVANDRLVMATFSLIVLRLLEFVAV